MHLRARFIVLCLLIRKLSCWQTNKQTHKPMPLKTSNALRYATMLGNHHSAQHILSTNCESNMLKDAKSQWHFSGEKQGHGLGILPVPLCWPHLSYTKLYIWYKTLLILDYWRILQVKCLCSKDMTETMVDMPKVPHQYRLADASSRMTLEQTHCKTTTVNSLLIYCNHVHSTWLLTSGVVSANCKSNWNIS